MPRVKKKQSATSLPIEQYAHTDKERLNNPPVGLVDARTDNGAPQKKTYHYDPHLDPQLVWAGKAERTSFDVPTVSLHVHERIDPKRIIEAVQNPDATPTQLSLFESNRKPLRQAIEFYQHKEHWTNRLIAGDSLLVMNSLLEKESMAGKVQMIYFDPPYGIKYGSNFQPFVNKRDVKDGNDEDLTAEPEQLKAFRDTWQLGIHSYLSYLHDRLLLARELLTESGSIFVQISDENIHRVRCIMDEVFGAENFVSLISFTTTSGFPSNTLSRAGDYIIWYARDRNSIKYRQLYLEKQDDVSGYDRVELPDGTKRALTKEEKEEIRKIPKGSKIYSSGALFSPGTTTEGSKPFVYKGKEYYPSNGHWKTSIEGMKNLEKNNRIEVSSNTIRFIRYLTDFPVIPLNNLWRDTQTFLDKFYVVQTNTKVIQRCLLMTTDPGDLVFDPTCGSGTTAYVAEQWGRRWITCDTSRVAITLARQRLMTAVFDYYELAHPEEGVGSGFKYKTVPHVTLKSIANNPEIDGIYARMHPAIEQALTELNAALKGQEVKFKVTTGGRAGAFVDFAAPDEAVFTMPSGQVVKVNELVEWEVPFEFPADWSEAAREPFERFHAARRAMQQKMDEAIARHAPMETLYDQPFVDTKKTRVTGPFTVEAVPAPVAKSFEAVEASSVQVADSSVARMGETLRQAEWRAELLKTGVRTRGGQRIEFRRVEPLSGTRFLQAEAETQETPPKRVVVCFGPEYAPLEQRMVELALDEARTLKPAPDIVLFCAFHFDPEARKDIEETHWPGLTLLEAQMNADLLTDDLKKKRCSNESFWLIGQPDVQLKKLETGEDAGKYVVKVHGFDYYNPRTGMVESGGKGDIAMWMLDHDYDGRSLFPSQVFFPMAGDRDGWGTLAKTLRAEIDEEKMEAFRGTVSLPFTPGRSLAVKIIDARGIESLKIIRL
ncbi:MAG: site-specific DNA-methyltransferase [Chloroherpetonaceae bacterium]